MKKPKVAVGGFLHETNTFVSGRAGAKEFADGGGLPTISFGAEVITNMSGANCALASFIECADEHCDLVPLCWASAAPSGPVTDEIFERVWAEIDQVISANRDLDAVYLDLHGAMVTETSEDGEGELLNRLRAQLPSGMITIASLDLHANVSNEMFRSADLFRSYRTYPHLDMRETGASCFDILSRILKSRKRPFKALRQLPFLIPTISQCTTMFPCDEVYETLKNLEQRSDVVSVSFNPGFPASDVPACRPSVLAYGRTQAAADEVANQLAELVAAHETNFVARLLDPLEAVRMAMATGRPGSPVIIADTQDNPGGGSTSDTMGMLKALVSAGAQNAAIGMIVDPAACAIAHAAGEGARVRIDLGGRGGFAGDSPLTGDFFVEKLSDGAMKMSGGFYGDGPFNLGKSACLRIDGIQIAVCSRVAQMVDQQMFRFLGVEPKCKSLIVVKSSVHFRASFEAIASQVIIARAPGGMVANPAELSWTRLDPEVRVSPRGQA